MKHKGNQKRRGRFIKKDHPCRKNLQIENFNLLEVSEKPITRADNSSSTIIHQKYHLESELEKSIAPFQNLDRKFVLENFRPVIKPLNFTHDWKRRVDYFQKHRSNIDEIEEIDPIFAAISDEDDSEEKHHSIGDEKILEDQLGSDPDNQQPSAEQPEKEDFAEITSSPLTISSDKNESSISSGQDDQPMTEPNNDKNKQELVATPDEFIPMHTPRDNHSTQQQSYSDISVQKDIEKEYEKAKNAGYENGFMQGEEKAYLQGQKQIHEITSNLKELINEMERLKSNILVSTQENFLVLCKSLAEALINQELKANQSAFESLLRRAIEEAVPHDSFNILVSKDAYETLKAHTDGDFLSKVKCTDSLEGFNFKIDSDLTVVDGNIRDMIEDLIEQANVDLFESKEQVS